MRIEVKNLCFQYNKKVPLLHNVNLTIEDGERVALVGSSGCGKSTLLRTVLRLIEPTKGKIVYDGVDITHMGKRELRKIRRHMQIVFQDPYSALDGRMKVGKIIEEPMIISKLYPDKATRMAHVVELMQQGYDVVIVDNLSNSDQAVLDGIAAFCSQKLNRTCSLSFFICSFSKMTNC